MREAEQLRKLTDYFKKNLKKGYTSDSLKWALIEQGYLRVQVERAIELATKELADEAPKLKEKPKITYEVIGEHNQPMEIKKPWWKKLFGMD